MDNYIIAVNTNSTVYFRVRANSKEEAIRNWENFDASVEKFDEIIQGEHIERVEKMIEE